MRENLVSVVRITKLEAIPGKDFIALAHNDRNSWRCIVKKTDFQVGDLGVFFEIDSFLPGDDERYAFLKDKKHYRGKEGYRIKSMKLGGVVSQGLLLPRKSFPELDNYKGDDIWIPLRVDQYETEEYLTQSGGRKVHAPKKFPYFIRKTDESRIQSFNQRELEDLDNRDYVVTEKLDGTSCTIYSYKGNFGVCSRNIELYTLSNRFWHNFFSWLKRKFKIVRWLQFSGHSDDSGSLQDFYANMALKYRLNKTLPELCNGRGLAIQGEICGPKVSDNRLSLTKQELYVFSIYDIDKQCHLAWKTVLEICGQLELKTVPTVCERFSSKTVSDKIDELIAMADGESTLSGAAKGALREGLVFKSIDTVESDADKNDAEEVQVSLRSFKVISNKYLLKWGL